MKEYTIRDLITEMLNICYKPFVNHLNEDLIKSFDTSTSYENFRFHEDGIKKRLKAAKMVKYFTNQFCLGTGCQKRKNILISR